MRTYLVIAILAVAGFVIYRRSKKTSVDKVNEEVAQKQKIENSAVGAGINATPLLSTRGEEPLTTFNASPTLAKIDQGARAFTQWFPKFGEIWN
jgi:hypothetical protein